MAILMINVLIAIQRNLKQRTNAEFLPRVQGAALVIANQLSTPSLGIKQLNLLYAYTYYNPHHQ